MMNRRRSNGPTGPVLIVWAALMYVVSVAVANPTCPAALSYPTAALPTGSCASYNSILPDGSLALCNGVVDYQFYLPNGLSQADLELAAYNGLTQGSTLTATFLSLLPATCAVQVKRVACLAAFQACELVDPYYADQAACPLGQACTTCGDITTPFPPQLFTPTSLAPSYGSICVGQSGPVGNASACIVGPGKVPGLGNIGWGVLKMFNTSTAGMSMDEFCALKGLHWSQDFQSCLAAIPRSPCKAECDKLWSMNRTLALSEAGLPYLVDTVCPLISGKWDAQLTALLASSDSFIKSQAQYAFDTNTSGVTSVPLTVAFGITQDCNAVVPPSNATFVFSSEYTTEFAPDRSISLGQLMQLQVSMHTNSTTCHCVENVVILNPLPQESTNQHCATTKNAGYCLELLLTTSKCFNGGAAIRPNDAVRFAEVNDEGLLHPMCKRVVIAKENQPSTTELQMLQAAFGLPSLEAANGAFYVGPAPGLPPLATGKMTDHSLCGIPDARQNGKVYFGKDSLECASAAVNAAEGVIPSFTSGKCRASFLDMLCNQVHMKLELKSLCLLPNNAACAASDIQGAATNTMPFLFALPRFPGNALCTSFKTECATVLDELVGTIGTPQRTLFEQAFNCSGVLSQTCASNNPVDGWTSNYWSCSVGLNGIPMYPAGPQPLASQLATLLAPYALANGLTNLAGVAVTAPLQATISSANSSSSLSTCECPLPLLVPEDPASSTIAPGVCCQQRCEGHMYTDEQFQIITVTQRGLSLTSFVVSFFVVITWLVFKTKRNQPLPLLFCFSAWNVSLVMVIGAWARPDIRGIMCKDKTTPMLQSDGGLCLFESIWLVFWTAAACMWWLCQTVDLYLRIVRGKRNLQYMMKYYHAASWGVALTETLIPLGLNQYGYERGQIWCLLSSEHDLDTKARLDLGMFYGVVATIWISGVSIMIVVLVQMCRVTSNAAAIKSTDGRNLRKMYNMYRTPAGFVFFFFFVWLSVISYRYNVAVKQSSIEQGAKDWVQCLLSNFAQGIPDPATSAFANSTVLVNQYHIPASSGCGEVYPLGMDFSATMYLLCIAYLEGTFVFFLFGLRAETINLWREKLRLTSQRYDSTQSSRKGAARGAPTQGALSLFSAFSAAGRKVDFAVDNPGSATSQIESGTAGRTNSPIQSGAKSALSSDARVHDEAGE